MKQEPLPPPVDGKCCTCPVVPRRPLPVTPLRRSARGREWAVRRNADKCHGRCLGTCSSASCVKPGLDVGYSRQLWNAGLLAPTQARRLVRNMTQDSWAGRGMVIERSVRRVRILSWTWQAHGQSKSQSLAGQHASPTRSLAKCANVLQ